MWLELVGKKVVALRAYPPGGRKRSCADLAFILFDDGETFLELQEQDKYDYHDCNPYARELRLRKDAEQWKKMMDLDWYVEANHFDFSC